MGVIVLLLCCSFVFLALKCFKWIFTVICERVRLIWLLSRIPGPVSLPLVGVTWQFKWKIEDLTEQLLSWQVYYTNVVKSELLLMWLGPFPIVVLLSPNAVKAVLESSDFLQKGDEYRIIERWLGQGLLTSKGDKWRVRRKLITPAFHFVMLNQYHQVHDEEAKIFVQQLQSFSESGESFDVFPFLKRCALDIICATAMGMKVNAQTNHNHPYVNAVKRMNELSFAYSRMPWLWLKPVWYLSGFGKEYDNTLDMVTDFTRGVISERQLQFQESSCTEEMPEKKRKMAFLDLLLQVQTEGGLTAEDIREEVDTFMFEGHDTTSSSMAWTLWCLAHHPLCQERVFQEVDRVFGGSDRRCTLDDLKQLSYLEQCIKESLRLFPAVPFFTRKLRQDFNYGGYRIPRNTTLLISPGTLHTSSSFQDPYSFDPSNFETEKVTVRHPFSFIPFSAGPRNCIGQKFALMEEKTVLSWLFRAFKVIPTRDFKANIACPEIILKPNLGIPIKIEARRVFKRN